MARAPRRENGGGRQTYEPWIREGISYEEYMRRQKRRQLPPFEGVGQPVPQEPPGRSFETIPQPAPPARTAPAYMAEARGGVGQPVPQFQYYPVAGGAGGATAQQGIPMVTGPGGEVLSRMNLPAQQGAGFQYFQPPEYVGPEDLSAAAAPPAVPGWGSEGAAFQPAQFYGFAEGDYDRLETDLYNRMMGRIRGELGARGTLGGTIAAGRAVMASSEAMQMRMQLQEQQQARQTRFSQDEALRAWQQQESAAGLSLQRYQLAQQEAASRRQWLWQTAELQHQDYWNQMQLGVKTALAPFDAVPYQTPQYATRVPAIRQGFQGSFRNRPVRRLGRGNVPQWRPYTGGPVNPPKTAQELEETRRAYARAGRTWGPATGITPL